jgi:hypothetical protein
MSIFAVILALASATAPATAAAQFVGTWSFDGTCASGDGMTLKADGKASYDEWGDGLWALADKGTRLVIIAEDIREDSDRRAVAELIEFKINNHSAGKLALTRASDGAKMTAVKCKAQ